MVVSSIFKEFFFLCRTFYTSLYKCILQNMKYAKAMFVWNIFKELYKNFT